MRYILDTEDMQCLLTLNYKAVKCVSCHGTGVEFVDGDGNLHTSRTGFENEWFYDSMEQVCEECNGLKVKVLLDTGVQI